jgi:hypothetical protein
MAITWLTGSLNPSSSTRARDIRQAFAAAFSGLPNWSVVDSNYVNGTTERSVIVNSAGFALMIYNSTTMSDLNVRFVLGRTYDVGTHTMSNIGLGFSAVTTDSSGFNTNTFNPTTIGATPTGQNIKGYLATTNQTAWSAHINTTYAVLSFKDGTATRGRALFIGAMESLVENATLTDTYPYVLAFSDNTVVSAGGAILNSVGNNSVNHSWQLQAIPIDNVGIAADPRTADLYNINPTLVAASPIFLVRNAKRPPTTESSLYGHLRGKLPETVLYADPTGALWGDTTDWGTVTYMYVGGLNDNGVSVAWWVATE